MRNGRHGFTLTEMAVATSLLVTVIALAMTGFLYLWSETGKALVQDRLDVEVQLSIEEIKRDLRLTALERIFYYPVGPGPYSAISLPLARDDNGDGAIDLDADGKIIWDKTVVYHVWTGNPTQLRKTTFDPRPNLTAVQLQEQINSVTTTGTGIHTHGGTNASTKVIFENLFTWSVEPQGSTYDGHSSSVMRDINRLVGSAVVSNGVNTIQFRVTGKNPAASGFHVGVDSLYMTPSASVREGERMLPALSTVEATPVATLMAGGSWSGNYQLLFPATAANQSFTLSVPNDRWVETNFRSTGQSLDNIAVPFDTSLNPQEFVVQLDGGWGINWRAQDQTGGGMSSTPGADQMLGAAVRVLVRGENIKPGAAIQFYGGMVFPYLRAGSQGAVSITDAFVAEAAVVNDEPTMDAVPGTMTRLRNQSGANSQNLSAGGAVYMGYPAPLAMEPGKSYLYTFRISSSVGQGNIPFWHNSNPSYAGSYIIPGSNAPTAAIASADVWSSRSDVSVTNGLGLMEYVWVSYATNATYTSTVFDTGIPAPSYSTVAWGASVPSGCYMGIRLRTADNSDMSDAPAWSGLTPMTTAGAINPGNKRFVQFQAQMRPTPGFASDTPKLRNLTVNWGGQTRVVDVGGTFTRGPNYGQFELLVNGQPLKKGVVVNLEIFDFARGHASSNRITSAATAEVTPRNTGR